MSEYIILSDCDIYTPGKLIKNGCILIEGEKIAKIGQLEELKDLGQAKVFNCKNHFAVPGFIDIHLHGGGGIDFMGSSSESIIQALKLHLENGTTSALPAILTDTHERILEAIKVLIEVKKSGKGIPEIIGLHLEGPYISREKSGAQLKKHIRKPLVAEMKEYIEVSEGQIKIMTLAPEVEGAMAFIHFLNEQGIIPSAGHTNATFKEMENAIKSGIRLATHLFNAMRGLSHREPGAAGALLLSDEVYIEVVADGFHVHPPILDLITKVKPAEKIILVTDATKFYGIKKEPVFMKQGKIFGSNTPLWVSLKNMMEFTGLSLKEILKTVTSNPAKLLSIEERKGHLRKGFDADIVLLDKALNVKKVFLKGKMIQALSNE